MGWVKKQYIQIGQIGLYQQHLEKNGTDRLDRGGCTNSTFGQQCRWKGLYRWRTQRGHQETLNGRSGACSCRFATSDLRKGKVDGFVDEFVDEQFLAACFRRCRENWVLCQILPLLRCCRMSGCSILALSDYLLMIFRIITHILARHLSIIFSNRSA